MTARRRGSGFRRAERRLYLADRTLLDIRAAQRGRLGRRLIRRTATRSLFQSLRILNRGYK